MATVWELRRLVPAARGVEQVKKERTWKEEERGGQTFKNDTEGALTNLPADTIVDTDEVCGCRGVLGHGRNGDGEEGKEGPLRPMGRGEQKRLSANKTGLGSPNQLRPNMYTAQTTTITPCYIRIRKYTILAATLSTNINTVLLNLHRFRSPSQASAPTALYLSHFGLRESHQNSATGPGNVAIILPSFLSVR